MQACLLAYQFGVAAENIGKEKEERGKRNCRIPKEGGKREGELKEIKGSPFFFLFSREKFFVLCLERGS